LLETNAEVEGITERTLVSGPTAWRSMDTVAILWTSLCFQNVLGQKMEAPGGFEPPTCGLGNRRSIHLSYGAG
jgi:hypothetical protein